MKTRFPHRKTSPLGTDDPLVTFLFLRNIFYSLFSCFSLDLLPLRWEIGVHVFEPVRMLFVTTPSFGIGVSVTDPLYSPYVCLCSSTHFMSHKVIVLKLIKKEGMSSGTSGRFVI